MMGLTDIGVASLSPLWDKALAFMNYHLKGEEGGQIAKEMGSVHFQLRDLKGYFQVIYMYVYTHI